MYCLICLYMFVCLYKQQLIGYDANGERRTFSGIIDIYLDHLRKEGRYYNGHGFLFRKIHKHGRTFTDEPITRKAVKFCFFFFYIRLFVCLFVFLFI